MGPQNGSNLGFGDPETTQDPSWSVLGPQKMSRGNRVFYPFLGHFVGILGPIGPSWAPEMGRNWVLGAREPPRTPPGVLWSKKNFAKNPVFGPFLDPFLAPPWAFLAQMAPFGGPNMAHMAVLGPQTCLGSLKKCFWAPQNFLKIFGFRLENGPRPRSAGPAARAPAPALPGLRRGP